MAYAFHAFAGERAGIGEFLSACFPHFEAAIVPFVCRAGGCRRGRSGGKLLPGHARPVSRGEIHPRRTAAGVRVLYARRHFAALSRIATHKLSIEAVDGPRWPILPRHVCRLRMDDDPRLNAALFEGATRALTLSIDHMLMIGRSSAEERLAWFLTHDPRALGAFRRRRRRAGDAAPGHRRLPRTRPSRR